MIRLELQFQKKQIPYLRTVLRQEQVQEQTQEVRLGEQMPDIGRVICSWGQVLIRGKEWRSNGISVSGGVMVWVLYAPEDGSAIRSMEAWLPIQHKWEFPFSEQDGTICVSPLLYGVDARSTGARKLMIRANVGMLAEALCPENGYAYTPQELPEDVCILQKNYPVLLPVEAGEKAFSVEEILSLPSGAPQVDTLLHYCLCPEVSEQRLLADKLVFRGKMTVHVLYADVHQELQTLDFELPFSQYAELDRDYDDQAKTSVCIGITNLELCKQSEDTLELKAGLVGQYTVTDCVQLSVVEDAYSPVRKIELQRESQQLNTVLEESAQIIQAQQTLTEPGCEVIDGAFYPEHAKIYREEEQLTTELAGTFYILSRDAEGQLHCDIQRWDDTQTQAAAENVKANVLITPVGRCGIDAHVETISAQMQLDRKAVSEQMFTPVVGLELGEIQEPNPNRPSLILCRTGDDCLWNIAKRTGSTVEAIKQANDLQDEPHRDKILLIPVL